MDMQGCGHFYIHAFSNPLTLLKVWGLGDYHSIFSLRSKAQPKKVASPSQG